MTLMGRLNILVLLIPMGHTIYGLHRGLAVQWTAIWAALMLLNILATYLDVRHARYWLKNDLGEMCGFATRKGNKIVACDGCDPDVAHPLFIFEVLPSSNSRVLITNGRRAYVCEETFENSITRVSRPMRVNMDSQNGWTPRYEVIASIWPLFGANATKIKDKIRQVVVEAK